MSTNDKNTKTRRIEQDKSAKETKAEKKPKGSVTKIIVYSALLSAVGIMIPLIIPKIWVVPGVMSVTIGSHIAVMLAMIISPFSAMAVTIVTAVGFQISTGSIIVTLRALSHILFALLGSFLAKSMLKKFYTAMILNVILALVHAAAETFIVYLCMILIGINIGDLSIAYYFGVLIFTITVAHSIVDFMISYTIYLPLKRNRLL